MSWTTQVPLPERSSPLEKRKNQTPPLTRTRPKDISSFSQKGNWSLFSRIFYPQLPANFCLCSHQKIWLLVSKFQSTVDWSCYFPAEDWRGMHIVFFQWLRSRGGAGRSPMIYPLPPNDASPHYTAFKTWAFERHSNLNQNSQIREIRRKLLQGKRVQKQGSGRKPGKPWLWDCFFSLKHLTYIPSNAFTPIFEILLLGPQHLVQCVCEILHNQQMFFKLIWNLSWVFKGDHREVLCSIFMRPFMLELFINPMCYFF